METVTKSVIVKAPLSTVYDQYTQFEQFPQFMEGVRSVQQVSDTTLQWTAEIGGKDVSWSARITEQVPDQVIAWESTSGKPNNGRALFSSAGSNETRVEVTMQYEPEGIVENVADSLGVVGRRLQSDLERFKRFVEQRGQETGAWRGTVHQGAKSTTS